MNRIRRGIMTAAVAGSLLSGATLGATALGAASSGAATAITQTSTSVARPTQPAREGASASGKSNENPGHEGKGNAQREAEESAGNFPATSPPRSRPRP
jgi:hypothetical protein